MKLNLKIPVFVLLPMLFLITVTTCQKPLKKAQLGDFPSLVIVIFAGVGPLCTGVLISSVHITLPGHCVMVGEPILKEFATVVAGDNNWKGGGRSREERNISWVLLHPKYNCHTFEYDIAVIKVIAPFPLTEYINLKAISDALPELGTHCVVAVWGSRRTGSLRYAKVPVIRFESCSRPPELFIRSKMICAGNYQVNGRCSQSSVGPLFCKGSLHGLNTGGKTSCDPLHNSLKYTAVYAFRNFLQTAVVRRSGEPLVIVQVSGSKKSHTRIWILFGVLANTSLIKILRICLI
ncbi:trypsin-like isoform X2 [Hermetia illucens]|uniref:trypsin-like isoform X2 n=1 Tax=Hermetia illucens TaxID=343691 RepID=UPI0018CC208F|nr:trypsin-like isoform X2 [Hermetia illucens]